MKKVFLSFLLAIAVILAGCSLENTPLPDRIEINYFYDEACASCDTLTEFWDIMSQELGEVGDTYAYNINTYNVFKGNDAAYRDQVFADLGFEEELIQALPYPVLTVNGNVYTGHDSIRESIKEAYLTAGEDLFVYHRGVFDPTRERTLKQMTSAYTVEKEASTIVYFYRTVCEECIQTDEEVISRLPESVVIDGVERPLNIIRINTRSGRNVDIMRALSAIHNVPEEDQIVPIVFTAKGYLAGYASISSSLLEELENGAGMHFQMPE